MSFHIIFTRDPVALAGKSSGISYYSYKTCIAWASRLRQNDSTKNISFHHVYVVEYSHPKDYLASNFLQNIRLSTFLQLVCENIASLKKSRFRNIRLLSMPQPASQVTHHCYSLLFNYACYFHVYRWLRRDAHNFRVRHQLVVQPQESCVHRLPLSRVVYSRFIIHMDESSKEHQY